MKSQMSAALALKSLQSETPLLRKIEFGIRDFAVIHGQ